MRVASPLLVLAAALSLMSASTSHAAWPPEGHVLGAVRSPDMDARFLETTNGDLLISLAGYSGGGCSPDVWTYRYATGGTRLFDRAVVNCPAGWGVADDDAGAASAAYFDLSIPEKIKVDHYLPDGNVDPAWSPPLFVEPAYSTLSLLAVASDDSGGVYMCWTAHGDSLLLHRMAPDGSLPPAWQPRGLTLHVNPTFPMSFAPRPILLRAGGGDVIALWIAQDSLRAQRVRRDATIAPGWPAAGLALGASHSAWAGGGLELVRSGTDHAIAVWVDVQSSGGGGDSLRAIRFGLDGTIDASWPSQGRWIAALATALDDLQAAPDGQGGALVAWEAGARPRALRILQNGSLASGWPAGGIQPIPAASPYTGTFAITNGLSGGLIVAWDDDLTGRIRWLLGDATPDPSQPSDGRKIHETWTEGSTVEALTSDGAGGGYVIWWLADDVLTPTAVRLGWQPYPVALDVEHPLLAGSRVVLGAPRPNPAADAFELAITLSGSGDAKAELLDVAGRSVRTKSLSGTGRQTLHIDTRGLKPGMYFVRVSQGGDRATRPVVILE